MAKVKVVLRKDGIKELLNSNEIAGELLKEAQKAQFNAQQMSGEEYNIRRTKTDRAGYNVFPETKEAKQDNKENNTLLKSI